MRKCFGFSAFCLMLFLQVTSCKPDDTEKPADPKTNNPVATLVEFKKPKGFPNPVLPKDNPLTEEGILLGRMLFYDPILSADSSMSCSTCHKQENAFATNNTFEKGIHGNLGTRSSMPIFNQGWSNIGLFWDGRSKTMEEQAVEPVINPEEMASKRWEDVILKLKRHTSYPSLYEKAFGTKEITKELSAKAIAQFLRTIVSASSKYDSAMRLNTATLTASEQRGLMLYDRDPAMNEFTGEITSGGSCNHCHGSASLHVFQPMDEFSGYRNNGLDSAETIGDFKDIGYAKVKPGVENYGKFKVPSLRNIALTAPYMHDSRFKTLEEVIDHYNNGGHKSPTIDIEMASKRYKNLGGTLHLSEQDKKDLIAFLKSLTDYNLTTNPAYSSPFK